MTHLMQTVINNNVHSTGTLRMLNVARLMSDRAVHSNITHITKYCAFCNHNYVDVMRFALKQFDLIVIVSRRYDSMEASKV